jgi:hypothetical protein
MASESCLPALPNVLKLNESDLSSNDQALLETENRKGDDSGRRIPG